VLNPLELALLGRQLSTGGVQLRGGHLQFSQGAEQHLLQRAASVGRLWGSISIRVSSNLLRLTRIINNKDNGCYYCCISSEVAGFSVASGKV